MGVFILNVIIIEGNDAMKKENLHVFYLFDSKKYLVKHNPILKKSLQSLSCEYSEDDVQKFINKLISWYNVKYSNQFLDALFQENVEEDLTLLNMMSFEALKNSFSVFEDDIFQSSGNDAKIIFLKHIITMAGWGLIYSKKTTPEYGYYRAKKLLSDFNSYYLWNLSPESIYLPTLKKDYSPHLEENKKLILEHEKRKNIKKEKKKFRFLFRH